MWEVQKERAKVALITAAHPLQPHPRVLFLFFCFESMRTTYSEGRFRRNTSIRRVGVSQLQKTPVAGVPAVTGITMPLPSLGSLPLPSLHGITASAVTGITASAVAGVTASAVTGVTASAVTGVTASAVTGVTASAVTGVTAITGVTAVTGATAVTGITAVTGVTAITRIAADTDIIGITRSLSALLQNLRVPSGPVPYKAPPPPPKEFF